MKWLKTIIYIQDRDKCYEVTQILSGSPVKGQKYFWTIKANHIILYILTSQQLNRSNAITFLKTHMEKS